MHFLALQDEPSYAGENMNLNNINIKEKGQKALPKAGGLQKYGKNFCIVKHSKNSLVTEYLLPLFTDWLNGFSQIKTP